MSLEETLDRIRREDALDRRETAKSCLTVIGVCAVAFLAFAGVVVAFVYGVVWAVRHAWGG